MSAEPAFLWRDAGGGGEGITGSLAGAWTLAARGLDPAGVAGLRVTVWEARTVVNEDLEVAWEPTGRSWAGHRAEGGDVAWESLRPPG